MTSPRSIHGNRDVWKSGAVARQLITSPVHPSSGFTRNASSASGLTCRSAMRAPRGGVRAATAMDDGTVVRVWSRDTPAWRGSGLGDIEQAGEVGDGSGEDGAIGKGRFGRSIGP